LHHPSEISFLQLNEFLGRGKNTPSFEIHYAAVCFSLEGGAKIVQSRVNNTFDKKNYN